MTNADRITEYIKTGINNNKRLGLELEHFVYDENYTVISYEQMAECLTKIVQITKGKPAVEDGKIMGVMTKDYNLSLEPGCQLEISIAPKENTDEIKQIYEGFRTIADKVFGDKGFKLYEQAVLPFIESGERDIDEIPLLPKERYKAMDEHFKDTGNYGKYMMRATASAQVSIDFCSEKDAVLKMRVLEKIAPIVAILTENRTGIKRDKKWNEYILRTQIWQSVDNDRCGYFENSLSENYSIERYAEYIYKCRGLLVKEKGRLEKISNSKVEEWFGDREIEDIDYLLSMYFPTVRIKKYIEYRVADSMPVDEAVNYITFIGIVYDHSVLLKIDKLFDCVNSTDDIYKAEEIISQNGYDSFVYGRPLLEWVDEIFNIVLESAAPEDRDKIRSLIPIVLINKHYVDIIKNNESSHAAEDIKIKEYLNSSTAKYHNRVVRTLYIPKIFTKKETKKFGSIIDELYGIFDKVIERYMTDSDYRKEFGFSKELEELILSEPMYSANIPIARIDLFFDEKTRKFKFCEFNTDGTSAMNEDRELNLAFKQSGAYKEFSRKYNCSTFELFDSWVDEALNIYNGSKCKKRDIPNVAIVDFLEYATINEFYIFKEAFERRGCKTVVCDIRDIRYDGERCYTENGMEIDMIYRRAVTSDILANMHEAEGFINAYKSGKICLLGDFRTQIVHNKILFKILHMNKTLEFLSKKEADFVKNHIPFTMSLDDLFKEENENLRNQIFSDKDNWIIKPEDSYGSKGVHAGVEIDDTQDWIKTIEESRNKKYIIQEFCVPYRLENIVFKQNDFYWTDTSNLTGLFVYNSKFKGIYSRISYEQMISTQYNEMSLPTIVTG